VGEKPLMDWFQFTASVISSLAWPAVVLAVVILLRRPLAGLLPLLRRFKYKDLEVEFDREVRELRDEAAVALRPLSAAAPPKLPEQGSLLQLASVAPRAAVVEAWLLVESAARRAIEVRGVGRETEQPVSGPQLTRALMQTEALDNAARAVFDRLRMLRNQAGHSPHFAIGEESAREYAELALALVRRLEAEVH
jgi:hypothetical protein